jgi:hypothetical protein
MQNCLHKAANSDSGGNASQQNKATACKKPRGQKRPKGRDRRLFLKDRMNKAICAPQKPHTASSDTRSQLVFMMQTAQDVLNCHPTIARQSMSRVQLRKVLRRCRLRSSWT